MEENKGGEKKIKENNEAVEKNKIKEDN